MLQMFQNGAIPGRSVHMLPGILTNKPVECLAADLQRSLALIANQIEHSRRLGVCFPIKPRNPIITDGNIGSSE